MHTEDPTPEPSDREPPNWWVLIIAIVLGALAISGSLFAWWKRVKQG